MQKIITHLFLFTLLLLSTAPLHAQNRCDELRKEMEQLEKRVREIKAELKKGNCGQVASECGEQKATNKQFEYKVGCAELRGSTLRINFQVKHMDLSKPNTKAQFKTDYTKAFDQNGRSYISNNLKVGDKSTDRGNLHIEMVYDTWYTGYAEFFIGSEAVNTVKLFQLYASQYIDFQNLEVTVK
jgi:hypothetical protein